jgi:hypothetical protein
MATPTSDLGTRRLGSEHIASKHLRFPQLIVGIYIIVSALAPLLYGKELIGGLVIALLFALASNPRIPRSAAFWTLLLVGLGTCGTLLGTIRQDPGAIPNISIYILEPLLLGLLLPLTSRTEFDLKVLLGTLDVALIGVAIAGLMVFLKLPVGAISSHMHTAIDLSGGAIRTNYQGYNSLAFLAPYGLVRGFIGTATSPISTARRALLISAALSGLILSGRRILYLELPVCLVFAIGASYRARRRADASKNRGRPFLTALSFMGGVLLLAGILNVIGLSLSSAISRTLFNVTLVDRTGTLSREAHFLVQQWLASPIIGQGSGAIISGYARSITHPWDFELTYLSVLMQFGLVGVGILAGCSVWIVRNLGRVVAWFPPGRALQAGFIGVLLASVADPYLFTSDGIWMFFVPFAVAVQWHSTMSVTPPRP